jgi:hypothetical protein
MDFNGQKLVCKLTSTELQERRRTVISELKHLLINKVTISDGYQYTFDSNDVVLNKLLSFIKSERLCCDFFSFNLSIEGERTQLEITGPEGSKQFLDHEVGL